MASINDPKCSVCGFEFSSTPIESTDLLPAVIAHKGCVCVKCEQLYCMNGAPRKQSTWVCSCGGSLNIRGLDQFGL